MKENKTLKINRDYLIRIGIEMFSVIFAVLLALLIDQWQSNKANRRLAETAYTNIKTELTSNQQSLTSMLATHDSLLRIMDSLIVRIENNDTRFSITLNGISFELLSDAAWEATKSTTAINYMDFEDIMDISSTYDAQLIYRKLMDDFFNEQLIGSTNDTKKDRIAQLYALRSILNRFAGIGHQLKDQYEEVIKKLDSK